MLENKGLNKLIGLSKEKRRANIDIIACKELNEVFPHCLIHGHGGIGKTSFARAIGEELGYHFVDKEAASLRHRNDIVDLLINSDHESRRHGKVLMLFIDECHRLTQLKQEVFYFAMAEWQVDQGKNSWYRMKPFTLVCATTQIGALDEHSFVRRFRNVWEMRPLHRIFIEQILNNKFRQYGIMCSPQIVIPIAELCSGIPRIAVNLASKLRNYVVASHRRHLISTDLENVLNLE